MNAIAIQTVRRQCHAMYRYLIPLAFLLPTMIPAPAAATSSDWHASDGGAVRLVTSGEADSKGRVRGALEIRLKPGWKTYWRNPGEAGIPPRLDIAASTNVVAADIAFPPPERVEGDYAEWAGYSAPVALPVTFTLSRPDAVAVIEADATLGVCQAICIPVSAHFAIDPGTDPHDEQDAAIVEAAYDALPDAAEPGFRLTSARREGDRLLVTAELPDEADDAELFVAPDRAYGLGMPRRQAESADTFVIDIHEEPDTPSPATIHYTLLADGRAVAGDLDMP